MAIITVHSALNHFRLLKRITRLSASGLQADAEFDGLPRYAVLECMAQLATLHVRFRLDFKRHAFLLKVGQAAWPIDESLTGLWRLTAEPGSQSSNTFAYHVKAQAPTGGTLKADLLIGSKPYDDEFKEHRLMPHYKALIDELLSSGFKIKD